MAKNSLFWGKASGKLGEMVLYRTGGEQRARTYVQNVKNPKTLAQMKQRIKMASLVGFFKSIRPILQNSFPNRAGNQSGFNAFMAASLPAATTAIDKKNAENGLSVPLGYAISRGTIMLPAGAFAAPIWTEGATNKLVGGIQLFPLGSGVQNENEDVEPAIKDTLEDAMQNMLSLYPDLDAQLPQKFNLVVVSSHYVDEGFRQESAIYKFTRVNGELSVQMPSQLQLPSGIYPIMLGTTAIGRTIILGGVQEAEDNGASLVGAFFSFTGEDGKTHVSTANMMVAHDEDGYIGQFQDGGLVYNQYLEDLGYSADNVLSTR